jgi:hypothetical protein
MTLNIRKIFWLAAIGVFCLSIFFNIWLFVQLKKFVDMYNAQEVNEKVLAFRNMFTQDVLLSDREVNFDTRLALETAVRNINDQEIFNQWEAFTKSSTKEEATYQAKKLLNILIRKTGK